MKTDKSQVKKILLITLSNLGDIILTTPVLEKLHDEFPEAWIDVLTGNPGEAIFTRHPGVRKISFFKKHRTLSKRSEQVIKLRSKKYDLVIDLKNSLIPYLVGAKYHSRLSVFPSKKVNHKKDEHLSKLKGLVADPFSNNRFFIPVPDEDRKFIDEALTHDADRKLIVVNPGAKSELKRWPAWKFRKLIRRITTRTDSRIFVIGNEDDKATAEKVTSEKNGSVVNMCCKTSLGALAELIRRADLVITNDSAPLHVASAVGTPTVAIFGPTDEKKYGPLAEGSIVMSPEVDCRPCEKPDCRKKREVRCISGVRTKKVFEAAREILDKGEDSS
ncbi:MAG: glycosyltransferase family 9 protein [Candidatus Omnitrophica bacterium]|nr:glycosyltransferase family 9 protein [Candidatus Omnitrophota bacterium]